MLINVELPNGITIKVESDWFYSLNDYQLDKFYENNIVNFEYHSHIQNPFDNSSLETFINDIDEDIEDDIDTSIDFYPEDY